MNRLRTDDRGQITTALVIVGTVLVFALALAGSKLGQATDQKGDVQTAADAAALAGAQQIAHDAPGLVLKAVLSKTSGPPADNPPADNPPADNTAEFDCGTGRDSASRFATQNGARLTDYCYYPGTDTVSVTVQSLTNSVSGSPAMATAQARVGVALGDCDFPSPQTSEPTPTPTATFSSTPSGSPPDVPGTVRCGDMDIPVVAQGGSVRIDLTDADFTPALKS
jgi:hypothetical protein